MFVGVSSATAGWHDLSQAQRNQAIIDRAYQDDGDLVGVSCKEWVRTVVTEASNYSIIIPSNDDYPCSWRTDQTYSQYCIGRCGYIQWANPGEIIQMVFNNGTPHTAIVVEKTATTITFIESNWDNTPNDYSDVYVKPREVTFTEFNNSIQCFSIYFIQ